MQDTRFDMNNIATLAAAAQEFRDNIWLLVENWMKQLHEKDGEHAWERIPETQLVDNLPALLRGVSKVIETPENMDDFNDGGVIYEAAVELGRNRRANSYTISELFYEQELLREIIWRFCQENLTTPDFYELEQRINRPLDKITAAVADSYMSLYATELKYLARRDKSTGFLNYESFKEVLADEVRRSRRYRHQFSLVMVDIDAFKEYADNFGSLEGELLVQKVAGMIARVIRAVDIPVRYAVDEFAIILPETPKSRAKRVAERIRRAVKLETRHSAEVRGDLKAPVTVSAGISSYPKDAETVDEMISLADEALHEAKKAGKDIVMWGK